MKSAIEELIFQNSYYMEDIKLSEDYEKYSEESYKIYNELKAKLGGEEAVLLDKLIDCRMGKEAEAVDCYLIKGFKTGIKLLADVIKD